MGAFNAGKEGLERTEKCRLKFRRDYYLTGTRLPLSYWLLHWFEGDKSKIAVCVIC